jgi:hypothetical protein
VRWAAVSCATTASRSARVVFRQKTTIWLPLTIHRALKERAARDGTSVRGVVLDLLAAGLAKQAKEERRR